jgi:hypothetical protein
MVAEKPKRGDFIIFPRRIARDRTVRRGRDRSVLRGSQHFRYTPRRLDSGSRYRSGMVESESG